MMTSNLLSRLLPANPAAHSIYDDLRAHDEASESDLEEQAGLALDEENLRFHDDELTNAEVFNGEDSQMTTESTAFLHSGNRTAGKGPGQRHKVQGQSAWAQSPRLLEEDGDDDVPESLLIEGNDNPTTPNKARTRQTKSQKRQPAIPGPSSRENHAHWEATQAQQRLHDDSGNTAVAAPQPTQARTGLHTGSARDKAMWRWINVTNVDNFMREVYDYYLGKGVWCMLLEDALNLASSIFVAIFVTFLSQCINYSKIGSSDKLSQILVPKCTTKISGFPNVAIWLFTIYSILKVYRIIIGIPRLLQLRDFYLHLLGVPDNEMQTISWQEIVQRIMALRDQNPRTTDKISPTNRKWIGSQSKERLDAHDIANRLMRKENYLIAMFNKEILDMTLPIPFLRGRQLFSRTLLWNLDWCIMDFVFNEQGQVRQLVLKDSHRRQLSDALRSRFLFAGLMNVLFAPAIIMYLSVVYFFTYFNEYKNNPSAISSRRYTLLAEWKFREFNELDHLFQSRLNMSHAFAKRYLDQFPKVKTVHFARFLAFVIGAIVSVLALSGLWDPELFHFEITHERTVLFYLTVLGALWAGVNGAIPAENEVLDPEYALRNVIEYTHYKPPHWENRLHTEEVKIEFASLYQMKVVILLEEVLSIIITPFILWSSLPKCSDQIIDFFREFTIHVDGVGYVCSFAVFDFKRGDGRSGQQGKGNTDPRDDYYSTKHGKMTASYYGFVDNYILNPKTGIQGHIPPGMRERQQFHPPPSFPGLMSPTLAADMQASRMGRSERRPGRGPQSARTPRFAPTGVHGSPMTSILLDPHHQPSSSGFGGRSITRPSRSRYQARQNIIEEPVEDEEEPVSRRTPKENSASQGSYDSASGLGESRWETSPTRGISKDDDEGEGPSEAGGVLGLLYQFQKAQTDGRPGVHI
ncbi:autophagy-related protein 9 [Tricladium varicosporioides]|nr:autophagy-related protein 9 [Hymenoscyphus varicosporioides]